MKKINIAIETTDSKMVESLRSLADFIEENKDMSLEKTKCIGNDDYMAWIDSLGGDTDIIWAEQSSMCFPGTA